MNEIGDALGTAVAGAALARAVEPNAGEGAAVPDTDGAGHFAEQACLNCGTQLAGQFCHACGQHAHLHRTMRAFLHDLAHGVLHLDGKTFRTIPLLAWKPGALTRRYIEGERARFVSPMALFLFSVFLMFAVFQLAGISAPEDLGPPVQVGEVSGQSLERQLDGLSKARASMADSNPASPIIDRQIEALERRIAETKDPDGKIVLGQNESGTGKVTFQSGTLALLDGAIEKWRANPTLMAYKLQSNFYKFSWLLIPLSLPFMWLIFAWKRRFGFYDHAVFVTYSLCFMSLLFVVLAALGQVPFIADGWLFFAGVLIPPVHIYKQLRGAYALSRLSALWRTLVLLVFITIILALFLNLMLVIGAFG